MPQDTGGILNLKKPVGSDDIRLQTIGIDLPYNFQKIDDAFTAHQAESAQKHITESGENANGRYVKFDDGTMICTHKITITGDVSTAAGALFRGNSITWIFPAEFLNNNIGVSSSIGGQTQMFTIGNVVTTSTCSFYPTRVTSLTNITYHIHLIAIGRWK